MHKNSKTKGIKDFNIGITEDNVILNENLFSKPDVKSRHPHMAMSVGSCVDDPSQNKCKECSFILISCLPTKPKMTVLINFLMQVW